MEKQDPSRSLGLLIHELSRLLRSSFLRRVDHLGLTLAQWQTLAHLSRNQGLKQNQLAEILEIQPITLTRVIDRLQAAGWVERRPDPGDRRAIQLYLTQAAEPLINELWKESAALREVALAGIPPEEHERLLRLLTKMKTNLQGLAQQELEARNEARSRYA